MTQNQLAGAPINVSAIIANRGKSLSQLSSHLVSITFLLISIWKIYFFPLSIYSKNN